MYKFVSGAKSVKQYRGDENLPEAKNGMKKCGCKHTGSKYKYASGTKSAYIPFTKMQPSQQKEYRAGMQKDADFTVTNIGRYAKPTKAQRELSARMDAKYKAEAKSKKVQQTPVQSKSAPAKTTPVTLPPPVQVIPTAPVVVKPTEESWTESQWKDFLKEKNSTPYVKPTPYIPVAKAKPAAQVITPQPKAKSKPQPAGKYLDPNSKGVLMSQKGKTLPKPEPKPLKDFIYNFPKDKTSKVTQVPVKTEVEEPSIIDTTKKFIKDSIKENLPDGDIKETVLNNPVSSWPSLAASAIRRKWAKENPEEERTATIKVPDIDSSNIKSSEKKSKVVQRPDVYITGDTLQDKGLDRRYHVPEIIDLDSPNITYGTRSRGEYNEIETEGAPITSAYPFTSSRKYFTSSKDPSHTDYMGIDSKGKIKIGKKTDFQDDDYQLSKTYIQNVESFEGLEQAIGNKNFKSPQVNIVTDSGVKMKTNLNFLVPKGDPKKAENTFDEVSGGRYIFETPDKKKRILVSGSLKTIKETFDKMKKDNPYLRVVSLDNGSYAKGIRTFDQKLTAEDLRTYDAQNPVGGGNIAYIKSRPKKYKYGTGALTIPEGSAIVTANGGKNKKALMAYKKGNYKLLNNIIEDMPEDNVDKAQSGKKKVLTREEREARYKRAKLLTGPLSPEEEADLKEDEKELQEDTFTPYTSPVEDKYKGEDPTNKKYRERLQTDPAFRAAEMAAGRAYKDKKGNLAYKYAGNSYKKGKANNDEIAGRLNTNKLPDIKLSDEDAKALKTPPPGNTSNNNSQDEKKNSNNRKGFDIPSLAEVAARSSILGQGVEGVPENYLKLGRYNYASQLDRTLRENAVAANTAKENIRDVSGGSAGSYLSNVANITAKRFDANAGAVTQDTLARQDILNKNVDLGNREAEANTGLKNQYAELRGKARSAYNDQLVALGQRIDSATETAQEMSNQRSADDQRMQVLKDLGVNYDIKDIDGLMKLVPKVPTNTPPTTTGTPDAVSKKGLKKVKTYKRK